LVHPDAQEHATARALQRGDGLEAAAARRHEAVHALGGHDCGEPLEQRGREELRAVQYLPSKRASASKRERVRERAKAQKSERRLKKPKLTQF
jgi:hypothetical protein